MASFGSFSRFILAPVLSLAVLSAVAQRDDVGSGRALQFDGVNDQIELGNIYDNVTLPITISAWIKLDADAVLNWAPILVSQDNADLYNGFWFIVRPDFLGVGYGDGQGEFEAEFRRGKEASITGITGRWAHVAAVVRGPGDMSLYVDGIDVGGNHSGSTDLPMSSNWPGDVARIGKWTSNGQTIRFKGEMDEVRFWRRALSATEIRATMCKKITTTTALAGMWSFNELNGTSVQDDSPFQFNGVTSGGPLRVFSGAAIGDISAYNYDLASLFDDELKISMGTDSIYVTQAWDLLGLQLYAINDVPSQIGGLNFNCASEPYFGVFVAPKTNFQPSYNIKASLDAGGFFARLDNSASAWVHAFTSETNGRVVYESVHDRIEVMPTTPGLKPDLGADTTICSNEVLELKSRADRSDLAHLWNTGANTPSIFASVAGVYWLEFSGQCDVNRDSIVLTVRNVPVVDFPESLICSDTPVLLTPILPSDDFVVEWYDGSSADEHSAEISGLYTVKVSNDCGTDSATVNVRIGAQGVVFPNVITPNGDGLNDTFKVTSASDDVRLVVFDRWGLEVYRDNAYHNDWAGADLATGVYYFMVTTGCQERSSKGHVSLLR